MLWGGSQLAQSNLYVSFMPSPVAFFVARYMLLGLPFEFICTTQASQPKAILVQMVSCMNSNTFGSIPINKMLCATLVGLTSLTSGTI